MSEEQSEEIEVLMSIFPDEFEHISDNPIKFKLQLVPNPGSDNNYGMSIIIVVVTELIHMFS